MIRCLITDGTASANVRLWSDNIAGWISRGVDLIQIRERDLTTRALAELTRKILTFPNPHHTKILINDRADVALACGADGVHLRDGSVDAELFAGRGLTISVACHSVEAVRQVRGAGFILLAPIFAPLSKTTQGGPLGLNTLRSAALATSVPILALGGITSSNSLQCVEAGAAGVAGITMFNAF